MNFFEEQEQAKRNTGKLVILLCLAVAGLIAISSVAVAAILALLGPSDPTNPYEPATAESFLSQWLAVLDWQLVGTVAALVVGVVIAGSVFKHFQLRRGGKAVAESLNARPIDPSTTDFEERKILNVVEEMAIASGIPVPPVYVMEDPGINAFAAGHTPQDAVIGVTRGCITLLNREELQGVVAHEFSHIFHGDMRLNTRLVATLNGILLIGLMGYILLRSAPWRRSSSRDNSAFIMMAIGLLFVVVGFAGTFFGRLIQAAVSRQREFLADASAVQFTRNPDGIANALKKIGGYHAGSQVQAPNATEYSHMFFSPAVGSAFSRFMATHPPLEQRIRRVQPDWDGNFTVPEARPASEARPDIDRSSAARHAVLAAAAGTIGRSALPWQESVLPARASLDAIEAIGQPSPEHVNYAQQTIARIDPVLREAAHDVYSARALIYGLMLDASEPVRARQLEALERHAEPDTYRHVVELADSVAVLDPRSRLPLVALSLPALKQLSDEQYIRFRACLDGLIMADRHVSLMEWALYRIVVHNIEEPAQPANTTALNTSRDDCEVLISALAHAGHENDADARLAFDAAVSGLPLPELTLRSADAATPAALEPAVIRLANLAPSDKRLLLQALARAVEHDGVVTVTQAELLRAIADSLDCPLPPLLADAADRRTR